MRAARRCTAPIKAPCPPPTMPSRRRRRRLTGRGRARGGWRPRRRAPPAKSSNALLGHPDDVRGDELGPLARAVLGVLEAALPLEHRPAAVVVGGELAEDAGEVDLAVARASGSGRRGSTQSSKPRIDALLAGRVELGVLDVERLDPLVVEIDELEIVERLQHEVRRVVVDAAARVVVDLGQEALEGGAVEQVLARMDLVADVDALLVESVEDRPPAPRQLGEGGVDQALRPRRPRIEVGIGQRAGEGDHGVEAEIARGLRAPQHLLHRPFLARLGVAAHLRRARRRRSPRRRPDARRPAGPAGGC